MYLKVKLHAALVIIAVLLSAMLYSIPTASEYLSSIPSFTNERSDISHGNYMVTGPGKVIIPFSEDGADIHDVIHYNDIRFIFDSNFEGMIKRLYFGDGSYSLAGIDANYLDHQYSVTGFSTTYSLTLELFNLREVAWHPVQKR